MKKLVGFGALGIAVCLGAGTPASAWTPPIGIPAPSFGINEVAPATPNPWTTPTPGFYYVDWSAANATDSGNPYGTPGLPRQTIPLSLPAGSVVEVHGVYDYPHNSPYTLRPQGTVSQPVFILGAPGMIFRRIWEVVGTYFVLENLEAADLNGTEAGAISIEDGRVGEVSHHGVIRHSNLHGNLYAGGIGIGGDAPGTVHDIVVWKNSIHHNGDVNSQYDQDVHGIAIGPIADHIWVVDNEISYSSGDGIQFGAGGAGQDTMHHIYVGRNISHHNKQSGFWVKQAVDVIFSQNTSYGHRPPPNSAYGAGMGFQYGPSRVWFLFNHVYDNEYGIASGSDSGGPSTAQYYIGNVIHNIHNSLKPFDPTSGYSQAGITLVGGATAFVVGNTIYDVDSGIDSPSSGTYRLANNIISNVLSSGFHILLQTPTSAAASNFSFTLFGETPRIRWGSSTTYDLTSFQAAFPGKGLNSVVANPLFRDATNTDFRLQAASPAIDAGTADAVYSTFFTLYGIDLAKDIIGTPRPQGPRFDLGAYEFTTQPTTQPTPPAAPTQLQER